MRLPGFEPGSEAREEANVDFKAVEQDFTVWLNKRMQSDTAHKYLLCLRKHVKGVVINNREDLITVCDKVEYNWNWFAKAVRNLINYYVDKRVIDKPTAVELKEVLKPKKGSTDTYVPSDAQIIDTLNQCKNENVKLLVKLLLYSGIRIREGLKVLNEFDPNKLHIYDGVAYYDIDWERGNKKALKAFMPTEFAKQLQKVRVTEVMAGKQSRRSLKLKHCRNWFINKCVEAGVSESLIQFMIGHSNGSILMTNYLEKINNSLRSYRSVLPLMMPVIQS